MKNTRFHMSTLLAALLVVITPAVAQESAVAPSSLTAGAQQPASKSFSQQELDQLLAPIALYPDALLAQIFMASTYPLEVVEAARWVKANPKVTGKALEDAMVNQSWDPAVKSLTAVPQVLQQMNEKLDWTQKLGDAFLAQQQDVMDTVQVLRGKASANGNLKSNEQQVVKTEAQGSETIYIVESAKPEVVYVPTYSPTVVYGSWWYPTPPYYMYPPAYAYAPGVAFATGVVVGAALWGACRWGWGAGSVNVNVNRYNSYNRTNVSSSSWNHSAEHRKGVAYSDKSVSQKYNRGDAASSGKSREDFRGKAESGRSELKGMDKAQLNDQMRDADRQSGRDQGGRDQGGRDQGSRDQGSRDQGSRDQGSRDQGSRDQGSRDQGGRSDSGFGGASKDRPDSGGRGDSGNRGGGRDSAGGGSSFSGASSGFSGAGNGASTREASNRGGASRFSSPSTSSFSGSSGRSSGGGGGRSGGGGGRGGGGRR